MSEAAKRQKLAATTATTTATAATTTTATAATSETTVVFLGIEDNGHINPQIALAEAFVQKGWTVHFFAPASVRDKVEGSGSIWCHYGCQYWDLFAAAKRAVKDVLQMAPDPPLQGKVRVMPFAVIPAVLDVMPHLVDRIPQIAPRFVVFDAAVPWGDVVARHLRIPAVCSMTALPAPMEERENNADKWPSRANLDAAAKHIEDKYGVTYNPSYGYTNYQPITIVWSSRLWHKGNQEFPPSQFHYWGPFVSQRKESISLQSRIDEALANESAHEGTESSKPVVYVSLGTVITGPRLHQYRNVVTDFYEKICAVADSLPDFRFIFAAGTDEAIGTRGDDGRFTALIGGVTVPANMLAVPRVNQPEVMKAAKVFVTHCGQNSCSEAMLHHLPVIMVPFSGDQFANADRFQELGAGVLCSYWSTAEDRATSSDKNCNMSGVTVDSLTNAIRGAVTQGTLRDKMAQLCRDQDAETQSTVQDKVATLVELVQKTKTQ